MKLRRWICFLLCLVLTVCLCAPALADGELFDFRNVSRTTEVGEGDIVFDAPELPVGAGSTDIPIGIWRP